MPPYLTPLQIFENYKKANPQKCKGKSTTEICKLAGLSDKQIAELRTTSAWLFCFDKKNISSNQDFNMTEIFGGSFSKKTQTKQHSKTNFNRKIEPTFQSEKQGDCWLLSDINALNQTEWGRQAIYDAIIPDEDNSGGVTIKFKGSPLKQKSFHITAEEIDKARKSGHYSRGDDDMIAFELATEKLAKTLEKIGFGKRITGFDDLTDHKSYISGGGIYDKNGYTMDISELILGQKDIEVSFTQKTKLPNQFLQKFSENIDNTASVCTFNMVHDVEGRSPNDPVHGNHAYAIKKFVYGKYVTLIDPYHSNKEIKLSWNKFINDVEKITIATKDKVIHNLLENVLPQKLKEEIKQSHQESAQINNKQIQTKIDVNIVNNIFPEVAKILINFDIPEQDLNFNTMKSIIKTDFLRNNDFAMKYINLWREIPFEQRKISTENVNKNNVLLLLELKRDFIIYLDNLKSGWGKGKEKKVLIQPIINALVEKAKETDIDNSVIDNFKNKCNKELDATFYTDEKVIQSEVEKMVKLIKSKS